MILTIFYDISTDDGDESLADFEKPVEPDQRHFASVESQSTPKQGRYRPAEDLVAPIALSQVRHGGIDDHPLEKRFSISPLPFEDEGAEDGNVQRTVEDLEGIFPRAPTTKGEAISQGPNSNAFNPGSVGHQDDSTERNSPEPQDDRITRTRSLSFESASQDPNAGPAQDYLPNQVRSSEPKRESFEGSHAKAPQPRIPPVLSKERESLLATTSRSSMAISGPSSLPNIPLEQRLKSTAPAQGSPLAYAKTPDDTSPLESDSGKQTKASKRGSFFGFLGSKAPKHSKTSSMTRPNGLDTRPQPVYSIPENQPIDSRSDKVEGENKKDKKRSSLFNRLSATEPAESKVPSNRESRPQTVYSIPENEQIESSGDKLESEKKEDKKRSGLFNRLSAFEPLESRLPSSRESLIAHSSGSRTDLLNQGSPSVAPIREESPGPTSTEPGNPESTTRPATEQRPQVPVQPPNLPQGTQDIAVTPVTNLPSNSKGKSVLKKVDHSSKPSTSTEPASEKKADHSSTPSPLTEVMSKKKDNHSSKPSISSKPADKKKRFSVLNVKFFRVRRGSILNFTIRAYSIDRLPPKSQKRRMQ